MPNSFKPILISSLFLLVCTVIIGGCDLYERAPTAYKFKYVGNSNFSVRSQASAGLYTIKDARVAQVLDSFLTKTNIKKNLTVTAKLDSLIFTIPDSINIDFSSYYDAILVAKYLNKTRATAHLDSIVVPLPNGIGKVNKVFPTAGQTGRTYDITNFAQSPDATLTVYYRTKKATPYLKVNMQYSVELSFTQNPNE